MLSLPGFRMVQLLFKSNRNNYFSAVRARDDLTVIVKTPAAADVLPEDEKRLRREYDLLKGKDASGLPGVLSLEPCGNTIALVMSPMEGLPLAQYLAGTRPDPGTFLDMAISITAAMDDVHRYKMIHKDITPENILVDPGTGRAWIIDFRFATVLLKEAPVITDPAIMEGTLTHMSPEQTGRMNRTLDYRTDFYSLGVVFYQMLTGHLPFVSADSLELVHAHLARQPVPPAAGDDRVPAMLSRLVMKLLSKNAEERYLSAHGLMEDLEICRNQYRKNRVIDAFELGGGDLPEKLRISQKLYGRRREIESLLSLFERSSAGAPICMAMISGHPGIGKTSLVQELFKPVTETKGYFIAGKFDPFHRNVPYHALSHAFEGLARQLLTETETRLQGWREKLRSALGAYGQIINDVIPGMALVIGPQPPVKKLDLVESQNRFNRVFMDFIRVIAAPEHPLVIFLDDLQWVDTATLKLIEVMMADGDIRHLLLIVTYRDNEVDAAHPLTAALKQLAAKNCDMVPIVLDQLSIKDTADLIADTLHMGRQAVEPFAALVREKTGGNPFFINQFLTLLNQEDLIVFNSARGGWQWSLSEIRDLDITENVVELLLRRLELMPPGTQDVTRMAACIGSDFDLKILSTVTDYTPAQILDHLLPAIREDLVVITSKPGEPEDGDVSMPLPAETFRFRHDRVRQAAYALIPDADKEPIHLHIGRILLDSLDPRQQSDEIFNVIHHLNMAADRITDRQERDEIAELNLVAGIKARSLAAFEPAFTYFSNGLRLLNENGWRRQYNLSLKLHLECTEAARLCGNLEEMEKRFDSVMENGRRVLDRVDAFQSRIQSYISRNRRLEALAMSQRILKEIGVDLPERPTLADMRAILDDTIAEASARRIDTLPELPRMNDPDHLAAMKIMGTVFGATYQLSLEWFVILVCQQVKLSLRHGNTSSSAIAYGGFGIILCGIVGDIEMGHRFGRLGLELIKRLDARELEAKMHTIFYAGVHHWKFHVRDTLEFLLTAHYTGIETGDFEFGSYNTFFYSSHAFHAGRPLAEVEQEMGRFSTACRQIHQLQTVIYISIYHQTVLNLQGRSRDPLRLTGEAADESEMLPLLNESNDTLATFYLYCCKLILCYLFEDYAEAVRCADLAGKVSKSIPSSVAIPTCYYFDSLSRLALVRNSDDASKRRAMVKVDANQALVKKWMETAPMNHACKYYLVAAEQAAVRGETDAAAENYDLAILHAAQNGYINEEALASELAAKFWLARGRREFAALFMQKAHLCYESWGAFGKIEQLSVAYPDMFSRRRPERAVEWKCDRLDLSTLMKSFQAISSEIVLDQLLSTMMKIVIENAGADRGLLILQSGEPRIVAEGVADADAVRVRITDATPAGDDQVSMAVLHYAARTREPVVLRNAAEEVRFGNDPYIRAHRPKSLMCLPIVHKGDLTGLIYLENRLTPDMFSPDRIEMLLLLTSQIAISIENTILFEEQKKAEAQYRGIFENAVEGIFLSTPEGRFISANPAMAQILGYESSEELCRSVTDIASQLYASPEDRTKLLRLMRKNETIKDFEIRFRRADGSLIWVSVNARTIFNENGELEMIEGFIIDISQRKAATDALLEREESLRKENLMLRSNIKDRYRFGGIIGKSGPMQDVYELILKAAGTDAPVIVYGESGTGKELVARAVHEMSGRREGQFVPVNCGAIPETLLESEFFGYKKGAFTGANTDKQGFLDVAHDGVLFLDELGEISLNFQVKLLRALEDGSYRPLGGQEVKTSNARVIAATNRDLQEAMLTGRIRKDFYYRIHIIPIYLPPLRRRREDIPLLIEHYINIYSHKNHPPPITGKMIEALLSHEWPGNVRELQNVLHRYCTLGQLDLLAPAPPAVPAPAAPAPVNIETGGAGYLSVMESTEKQLIVDALQQHQWNRKNAAAHLGIPLRSFYRKLKQYGVS